MTERIRRYWAEALGVKPRLLEQPGFHVVPHARKWKENFAYLFVRGKCCIISVAKPFIEPTRAAVSSLSVCDVFRLDVLSNLFGRPLKTGTGPAYQGYAEKGDFRPVPGEGIRVLANGGTPELLELKSACSAREWEHSAITESSGPVFAAFVSGQTAAAAHYAMWASYAAAIGVITRPEYRGRGFGTAVVSAAMQHALDKGHMVVYQTLEENRSSVCLAGRLGCKQFASTLAFHFDKG